MPTIMRGEPHIENLEGSGVFSILNMYRNIKNGFTFKPQYGYKNNPPKIIVIAEKANHGLSSASLHVNSTSPLTLSADI